MCSVCPESDYTYATHKLQGQTEYILFYSNCMTTPAPGKNNQNIQLNAGGPPRDWNRLRQ